MFSKNTQLLLDYEKTDVDLQEKRDGDTPLHLAVRLDHEEARNWVVRTLLESGKGVILTSQFECLLGMQVDD